MNKEEMIKKYEDYRERLNAYEKLVIQFTHMASLNREFQKNYPYFVLFYIFVC